MQSNKLYQVNLHIIVFIASLLAGVISVQYFIMIKYNQGWNDYSSNLNNLITKFFFASDSFNLLLMLHVVI